MTIEEVHFIAESPRQSKTQLPDVTTTIAPSTADSSWGASSLNQEAGHFEHLGFSNDALQGTHEVTRVNSSTSVVTKPDGRSDQSQLVSFLR